MFNLKISAILSLFLITGCSGHPGAGDWLTSADSTTDITKISVFISPKVLIYTANLTEPTMQCGWWALDTQNIEMECVHLSETDKKEKFQLNVTDAEKADLFKGKQLISRLVRQK